LLLAVTQTLLAAGELSGCKNIDDLEVLERRLTFKKQVFGDSFQDFRLRRISRLNCTKITEDKLQDNLRMKFLA